MFSSRLALVLAVFAPLACGLAGNGHEDAGEAERLVVSAAVSVSEALRAVSGEYARVSGVEVVVNAAGSDTLATQLIAGARADLFLSADDRQMDRAEAAGRILSSTRADLLTNQLVVAVPTDQTRPASSVEDLAKPWVRRFAMGDPDAVPAGVYAQQYLQSVGLWDTVRSKVVPTRDVRAVLAAVEAGNVDAGFVYRTDLIGAKWVSVAFAVPVDQGPRIRYPIAVLTDAPNTVAARRFLGFLRGPEARGIFEEAGFIVVGGAP